MENKEYIIKGVGKYLTNFYGKDAKTVEGFLFDTIDSDPIKFWHPEERQYVIAPQLIYNIRNTVLDVRESVLDDINKLFPSDYDTLLEAIRVWYSNRFNVEVKHVNTWM